MPTVVTPSATRRSWTADVDDMALLSAARCGQLVRQANDWWSGRKGPAAHNGVMTFPTGVFLAVLGCSLAAVALVMAVSFAIGTSTGKYSIIDAIWGPGFAVIAVVAFLVSLGNGDPTLRWLVLAMVVIWGLRLGGYILFRNKGLPEDPRYEEMLADARVRGSSSGRYRYRRA